MSTTTRDELMMRSHEPTFAEAYRAGFEAGRRGDRSYVSAVYLATAALERAFAIGALDGMRRPLRRAS